eukprot:PhM_4_TR13983/c1_g2_i1/m.81616
MDANLRHNFLGPLSLHSALQQRAQTVHSEQRPNKAFLLAPGERPGRATPAHSPGFGEVVLVERAVEAPPHPLDPEDAMLLCDSKDVDDTASVPRPQRAGALVSDSTLAYNTNVNTYNSNNNTQRGFKYLERALNRLVNRLPTTLSLEQKWGRISSWLEQYNVDIEAKESARYCIAMMRVAKQESAGFISPNVPLLSVTCHVLREIMRLVQSKFPFFRPVVQDVQDILITSMYLMPPPLMECEDTLDNDDDTVRCTPSSLISIGAVLDHYSKYKTYFQKARELARRNKIGRAELEKEYIMRDKQVRAIDRAVLYWQAAFKRLLLRGWRQISRLETGWRLEKQKLVDEISELRRELESSKDQVAVLTSSLSTTKKRLTEAKELNEENYRKRIREMESTIRDLQNEIQQLHEQRETEAEQRRAEEEERRQQQEVEEAARVEQEVLADDKGASHNMSSFSISELGRPTSASSATHGHMADSQTVLRKGSSASVVAPVVPLPDYLTRLLASMRHLLSTYMTHRDDGGNKVVNLTTASSVPELSEIDVVGAWAAELGGMDFFAPPPGNALGITHKMHLYTKIVSKLNGGETPKPQDVLQLISRAIGGAQPTPKDLGDDVVHRVTLQQLLAYSIDAIRNTSGTADERTALDRLKQIAHEQTMRLISSVSRKRRGDVHSTQTVEDKALVLSSIDDASIERRTVRGDRITEADAAAAAEAFVEPSDVAVTEVLQHYQRCIEASYNYLVTSKVGKTGINGNEFCRLMVQCQLADKQDRARVLKVFRSVTGDRDEMGIKEYVAGLACFAEMRYGSQGVSKAEQISNIIERHLLPFADASDTADFLRIMDDPEIRNILSESTPILRKAYMKYTISLGKTTGGAGPVIPPSTSQTSGLSGGALQSHQHEKEGLTLEDFQTLVRQLHLTDTNFTHDACRDIFIKLQEGPAREYVGYPGFERLVVAMALYRYPQPFYPLQQKLRRFIAVWMRQGQG